MRVSAFVLGTIGGVVGIGFGLFAIAIGSINSALDNAGGTQTVWLGGSAIASSLLGLACAGLGPVFNG
jgi:hypothetical protein